MEEKGREIGRGKGRERWYPTFWYKVTPMSASDIHTRRIGIATSNQSALFMMSIYRYYVKCLLYSVDSTASQQPASLQLQDIEDTSNDYTFMDDVTSYLNLCTPRANKKNSGPNLRGSCKCIPRQRVHPLEAKQESNLLRKLGRSGRWERLFRQFQSVF